MILYEDDVASIRWKAIIGVLMTIFVGVGVCSLMNVAFNKTWEDGYKQACIDFYNGKVRYELVKKKETGETRWERLQK